MKLVVAQRLTRRSLLLAVVAAFVACCSSAPPPAERATPVAPTPDTPPGVGSRVDPRWVDFVDPDGIWTVVSRDIAPGRQTLGVQPLDDTRVYPNDCPGCNHSSATAMVTVYARGAYDPVAVHTGEPVTVNGAEGFFLPPRWPAGAVLAWQYDTNAWATAQGRSKTTGDADRLLQLAALVHPSRRTPVRVPLSLAALPADMPLSLVDSWGEVNRTTLSFAACGTGLLTIPVAVCAKPSDELTVRLLRSDEFSSSRWDGDERREVYTIPVKIGDRDGYLHQDRDDEAAIKVAPGVVVEFTLLGPSTEDGRASRPPAHRLEDVLADVVWASRPADEETWSVVDAWAR